MDEIADDMINGLSCSWCGIYFTEEHGHPVVCKECAIQNSYHTDTIIQTDEYGIKMIGGMIVAHLPELGEKDE